MIAEHAELPNAEVCFTLGLLHDIGKVVLADILLALSKERSDIDETAILHIFSALHEEFEGSMLIRWDFSVEFEQVGVPGVWQPETGFGGHCVAAEFYVWCGIAAVRSGCHAFLV